MKYTLVDDLLDAPDIKSLAFSSDSLILYLVDGRSVSGSLLSWPTLLLATDRERLSYEIRSYAVHWPLLDYDLSSECLLRGAHESKSIADRAWARLMGQLYPATRSEAMTLKE